MPQIITCPKCGKKLRAPDNLLGKAVSCPSCGRDFIARAEADAQEEDEQEERAYRRQPRDEYEDEDDRPRRRRRDRYADEEDWPRRRGRRARVTGIMEPAIALLSAGILGLLMGGLYIAQAISGRVFLARGDDTPVAALWTVAFVGTVWGAVVTLGGVKLMRLESRTSVVVASIFAMLPCNICCLAGLPIGIWALIVLARPDVKDAFR